MRKAQASSEFLVTMALILLILIILGFIIHQKYIATNDLKVDIKGGRIVGSIAANINEIYISGSGYSQYLELPYQVYGNNYTVKFYYNEPVVEVSALGMTWSSPLYTPWVNCSLNICYTEGGITTMNVNSSIRVRARNKNGVIYLER